MDPRNSRSRRAAFGGFDVGSRRRSFKSREDRPGVGGLNLDSGPPTSRAGRSFQRRFSLAEHVKVTGARLENGLLRIDLVREVPEAMRPRRIEIGTAENAPPPNVLGSKRRQNGDKKAAA